MKTFVDARIEQLAHDGGAFFRVAGEQLAEFALSDHDDLAELAPVDSQQLFDGGSGFSLLCDGGLVGAIELDGCRLFFRSRAALFRTGVLGGALDAVLLASVFELEIDIGFSARVCKVASQALSVSCPRVFATACLAVQSKADGVENGRLSRPGVAADQVEAVIPQVFQGDDGFARIGAEGADDEFGGAHVRLPFRGCFRVPSLRFPLAFRSWACSSGL